MGTASLIEASAFSRGQPIMNDAAGFLLFQNIPGDHQQQKTNGRQRGEKLIRR